jgi:hypothetical protein
MTHPPSAFGAPPWEGGAASGPATADPRRPLGFAGGMRRPSRIGVMER